MRSSLLESTLPLAALLMLLVALSLPGHFARSIHGDETITLLETADGPTPWPDEPVRVESLQAAFQGRRTPSDIARVLRITDVHPPVYYWVLSYWKALIGSSLVASRLFSLPAMLASVVIFYFLVRSSGAPSPFLPSLFLILCTYTVHSSHEARGYALAFVALLGAMALAWRAVKREPGPADADTTISVLGSAALGAAAVLTNYFSVFSVATLSAWFMVVMRRSAYSGAS